jgi:hypothetical protein
MTLVAVPPEMSTAPRASRNSSRRRPDRLVGREPREDLGGVVDGVVALPGTCRVRRDALGAHLGAQRALAATLDAGVGGLQQHREVGVGEQVGPAAATRSRPLWTRVDLLGLVEDEGEVAAWLAHLVARRSMTATPPFMSTVPRPQSTSPP